MEDDKHQTTEATYLSYFGKNYLFHIVEKEFPLPEDSIIGLPFFHKFPRYAITQKFLVIDKWKLPLYCDGEYIPKNSAKICQIQLNNEDHQVVWIENRKEIPDDLYAIKNNKLEIPLHNYDSTPHRVPEHINFEKITSIETWHVVSEQKGDEVDTLCYDHLDNAQRLQELQQNLDLKHIEPKVRKQIKKILLQYHEVFTLKGDPLSCTSLTEHEIILKTGKIINLRSHKLPEAHREFDSDHTKELLEKGLIRHSQSPFSSPIWIVPRKGNKLRMVTDYRQLNKDTD